MTHQTFLVRVNPDQWKFKGREKDWEKIDEGDWVPFWGEHKYKEDIEKARMFDIIIGYSCYEPKKCIESLGRVISNGLFDCIDGKRFLIQKTTQLKQPINRDLIKDILESDPKLNVNQPTVTLINEGDWKKIKSLIIEKNPELKGDIEKLDSGNNEW